MNKAKDISSNCILLIEHFECAGKPENFLKAYQDDGGTWTIGSGTIRYPDGTKVKQGDIITLDEAREYLRHDVQGAVISADALTTDALEQRQFDALVSFVYNEGAGRYKTSSLRAIVNKTPDHYKAIADAFAQWKYCRGKVEDGLIRRRKAEAYLYVYGDLKFFFKDNDNIIN